MDSTWKEEAWKTKVHVMEDYTITKLKGGGVYDWNEQHHRTGNEIKRWRYIVTAFYTEVHKLG